MKEELRFSFFLNIFYSFVSLTLDPKKTWVLGLGFGSGPRTKPKAKTQRDQDSEFNSIHFGK